MKNLLAVFLSIIISGAVFSQTDPNSLLDAFVQETYQKSEVLPAISIAIVSENEILYQKTLGYNNIEAQHKASDQSIFYIASCTKAYNGLLAHILANEGKIDLYAPILNYEPFKNFENKAVFENITINDLLTHQSGIDNPYLSFRLAYSGEYTYEEIMRLIEEETIPNETGKAFSYTNFGYYLFDVLLREEFGDSWKDLLEEKIIQPLEMQNTTAYVSRLPKENLALPHSGLFKGHVKVSTLQKNDELMHAAGGLMTTTADAAKFLMFFLYSGSDIYPDELIANTYQQQVEANHEYVRVFSGEGYASGWRTGLFEDQKIVYHFGGYTGYFAHLSFMPEKKLGMAIFVNSDWGMTAANLISKYAYNLYFGNRKGTKEAEKILNKKIKKFLAKERKQQLVHQKKLAERSWNLSLSKDKYAGTFHNSKFGTVEVIYQDNQFLVKAGLLQTVATPFPAENTIRVELVPGSGTVIGFDILDDEVVALYHKRDLFTKIN